MYYVFYLENVCWSCKRNEPKRAPTIFIYKFKLLVLPLSPVLEHSTNSTHSRYFKSDTKPYTNGTNRLEKLYLQYVYSVTYIFP